VCQIVPLCLSYSSILLDWVAINKGSTCFCTDLAFCSGKAIRLVYARVARSRKGFLRCSPPFAIVSLALVEQLEHSLMSASGCC
jgi:hypothetical protein